MMLNLNASPLIAAFAHFVIDEAYEFIDSIFASLPGRTGRFLRLVYFSILFGRRLTVSIGTNVRIRGIKGISLGDNIIISDNCFISALSGGKCVFGDNVALNVCCHVNADMSGKIIIGKDSIFGPNCFFRSSNHTFGPLVSPRYLPHQSGRIVIGEGVWCGANCVFLRGASVAPFSVVGASAVVCKCFSERALLVGIPASIKRFL
jgi:acetyltransferase-like isoleucine patch superfamily enzyme